MPGPGVAGLPGRGDRAGVGDELHPLAGVPLGVDVGDVLAGDLEGLALGVERRQRDPQAVEVGHSSSASSIEERAAGLDAGGAPAVAGADLDPSVADGGQHVADGLLAPDQQLPVGLHQGGDLVGERQERLPVLDQDALPRRRGRLGQLPEAGAGREPEVDGDPAHLDGPLELGLADLLEDHLHFAGGAGQPTGAPGGQHELLLVELEQQQLEQMALSPQNGGNLSQTHAVLLVPQDRPGRSGS